MEGLGFAVGIKAYCPPGSGNCRNRPGDRFPGTAWIGQYWRQDASRQHGVIGRPHGIKAPHGEENDSVTVTGYRPVPSATMLSKGLPVCQMVLPFFPPLNRSRAA